MQHATQPNAPQASNDLDWLWAIGGILAGLIALYYFVPEFYYSPWLALKGFQLEVIRIFPVTAAEQSVLQQTRDWLASITPDAVRFDDVVAISSYVGETMKIPAVALLCVLGFIIAYRPAFHRRHTFESLIAQESRLWPHLRLLLKHHPEQQSDPAAGPWAMRTRPADWARANQIIKDGIFSTDAAAAAFTLQLGRPFSVVEAMSDVEQQLFAVFASRIAGDTTGAQCLLDNLSLFYADEFKADALHRQVADAIHRCALHHDVQSILRQHAWTSTILIAMFSAAKRGGILPSSLFLWLKLQDRTLWYAMNDVGRHVASTEAAGPRAHYLAERVAKTRLEEPAVATAVTALREGLQEEGLLTTC